MPQRLSSTANSHTNSMVDNFTRKINCCRLVRVNKTRVKLRWFDTGNQNPKVDTPKLSQMSGIGIEKSN